LVREIRGMGGKKTERPRISWSGKAATRSYWKCHGKKRTENTEILLPRILRIITKIGGIPQVFSVVSVQNSVAKNLYFREKDPTVNNTKGSPDP